MLLLEATLLLAELRLWLTILLHVLIHVGNSVEYK